MIIKRAYKVELDPNNVQIKQFYQHSGACRHIWNWGLAMKKNLYESEKKSIKFLGKGSSQLVTEHKQQNTWLYDVASTPLIQTLKDLDQAFANFFRRVKLMQKGLLSPEEVGYPKFKSRDKSVVGFRFREGVQVSKNWIKLPRPIGWVLLKEVEYLPEGRPLNTTISCQAGRWFAAVGVEEEIEFNGKQSNDILGVHLGIRNRLTCSDGTIIDKLMPYCKAEDSLKRLNRWLHRKKPGSKNRNKMRQRIARAHFHIKNIRRNSIHEATTEIIRQAPLNIVIEDWANKEMMKKKNKGIEKSFAKEIADVAFYEPRRQLEYKSEWSGVNVIVTKRGFPSSKICSGCGFIKKDFKLSQVIFKCDRCGLEINRETNAARNLRQYGLRFLSTGVQPGSNACGEGSFIDADNSAKGARR